MTGSAAGTRTQARLTPRSAAQRGMSVRPRRLRHQAGIVHLGLSNFHRAHQAVYTASALELEDGPWGIVGVARQSRDVLDALESLRRGEGMKVLIDPGRARAA